MTSAGWSLVLGVQLLLLALLVVWRFRPELLQRLRSAPAGGVALREPPPQPLLPAGTAPAPAGPPPGPLLPEGCVPVPRALIRELDATTLRLYCDIAGREVWHDDGTRTPCYADLGRIATEWPKTAADSRANRNGISKRWIEICLGTLLQKQVLRRVEATTREGVQVGGMATVLPQEQENPDQTVLPHVPLPVLDPQIGTANRQCGSTELQIGSTDRDERFADREPRFANRAVPPPASTEPGAPDTGIACLRAPGDPIATPGIACLQACPSTSIDVDRRRDRIDRVDGASAPVSGPRAPTQEGAIGPGSGPSPADQDGGGPAASENNAASQHNESIRRAVSGGRVPAEEFRLQKRVECDRRRKAEFIVMNSLGASRYPSDAKRYGVLAVSVKEAEDLGGIPDGDLYHPLHEVVRWLFPHEEACRRACGGKRPDPVAADQLVLPVAGDAPPPVPDTAWLAVRDHLAAGMSEPNVALWLDPITVRREGAHLVLSFPNKFLWEKFRTDQLSAAQQVLLDHDPALRLRLEVEGSVMPELAAGRTP